MALPYCERRGLWYCPRCKRIFDPEKENYSKNFCGECEGYWKSKRKQELKAEKELKDRKAIAKACREISRQMAATKDSQIMPAVIARLQDKLGGPQGLADLLLDDFNRARGEGLTEDEFLDFKYSPAVIQKYHQMLIRMYEHHDDTRATDLSSMADEDLQAVLIGLAMQLVREDKNFRREVALEALKEDPGLLKELTEAAELNVLESGVEDYDPDG